MSTPAYTDLVTVAEVRSALSGSGGNLPSSLADASSDDYAQAVEVIHDVTRMVEEYLNRQLIVREQSLEYWGLDWRQWRGCAGALQETAWARQWPLLQIVSVDGDTTAGLLAEIAIESETGGQRLYYDPAEATIIQELPWGIVAFAGYRRADQNIDDAPAPGTTDLRTIAGLETLAVLPPLLPYDIRRAALRLVVAEMRQQRESLVGLSSVSRRIDNLVVQAQKPAEDLVEKELVRIHHHRYVPV